MRAKWMGVALAAGVLQSSVCIARSATLELDVTGTFTENLDYSKNGTFPAITSINIPYSLRLDGVFTKFGYFNFTGSITYNGTTYDAFPSSISSGVTLIPDPGNQAKTLILFNVQTSYLDIEATLSTNEMLSFSDPIDINDPSFGSPGDIIQGGVTGYVYNLPLGNVEGGIISTFSLKFDAVQLPVPLPPALALFGAAILTLGGANYARHRVSSSAQS